MTDIEINHSYHFTHCDSEVVSNGKVVKITNGTIELDNGDILNRRYIDEAREAN